MAETLRALAVGESATFPALRFVDGPADPPPVVITREDERSYDSGDYPKVVFADMVDDDEYCGSCQNRLV
jgi:hypothetical protein